MQTAWSGRGRPSLKQLDNHVVQAVADKWRDLGVQLLNSGLGQSVLDITEANHKQDVVRCCQEMFSKWLETQENASWDQLLEALRSPSVQLTNLANQIEQMMVGDDDTASLATRGDDMLLTFEDLIVAFAITTSQIKQALSNSSIDVSSVIEQLQTVTAVRDRDISLFDKDAFENVATVETLWQKLSRFWSIFNCDLLKILLRIVQCKKAKEILEEFLLRIDISALEDTDLVLHYEILQTQGLIKPLLRIKVKAERCTNSIKKKVEEVVSLKFNLKEYTLCFKGIKQHECIELVYEISNAVTSYLLDCNFTKTDAANFAAHGILLLQINDVTINDVTLGTLDMIQDKSKKQFKEVQDDELSDEITDQSDVLVTVASLIANFKSLVLTVSAILDNSTTKESDLKKCRTYCSSLRTSDDSDQPLFSFHDVSLMYECTDFNELLIILNWHLSWDEHSILTRIVDKCQSVKAREEIENFDKKLAEISESLEITSCPPEDDLPPEFKKIGVIINKPFKTLSKHKYEEIKEFVFKQLDTRLYVTTSHVKVLFHPFCLEWYVSGQAVPYMINMAFQNKDAFVKEDFVFMQIGRTTIFDNQDTLLQPSLNERAHEKSKRPKKRSLLQRARTETILPDNPVSRKLQAFLEYRAKSCLHFFDSTGDEVSRSSSRSPSPSFRNMKASSDIHGILDTIHDDFEDDTESNEVSDKETSVLSALDKPYCFTDFITSSANVTPTSELIMKIFDNDDIEGVVPPRFLEDEYPDAVMYKVRTEHSALSSIAVSSNQSSVDGEVSMPSYDVNFVMLLRKNLIRVSTSTVTRASFSSDGTESLPSTNQLDLASETDEDSCISPVSNDEYDNEPSPVFPQFNRERRRSTLRSRHSVLKWLAYRSSSITDSHRDSIAEENVYMSSSEASDVESYHSGSDDGVVAA